MAKVDQVSRAFEAAGFDVEQAECVVWDQDGAWRKAMNRNWDPNSPSPPSSPSRAVFPSSSSSTTLAQAVSSPGCASHQNNNPCRNHINSNSYNNDLPARPSLSPSSPRWNRVPHIANSAVTSSTSPPQLPGRPPAPNFDDSLDNLGTITYCNNIVIILLILLLYNIVIILAPCVKNHNAQICFFLSAK